MSCGFWGITKMIYTQHDDCTQYRTRRRSSKLLKTTLYPSEARVLCVCDLAVLLFAKMIAMLQTAHGIQLDIAAQITTLWTMTGQKVIC